MKHNQCESKESECNNEREGMKGKKQKKQFYKQD